jgi:hypothetical protein
LRVVFLYARMRAGLLMAHLLFSASRVSSAKLQPPLPLASAWPQSFCSAGPQRCSSYKRAGG